MSIDYTSNDLLTPEQVAEHIRVTTGTLSVWRCTKRYPLKFVKVGHLVRYRPKDVEEFLRDRKAA
jgi:hypothetical protein